MSIKSAAHYLLLDHLHLHHNNHCSYHNCHVLQAFGRRRFVDAGHERAKTAGEAAEKRG